MKRAVSRTITTTIHSALCGLAMFGIVPQAVHAQQTPQPGEFRTIDGVNNNLNNPTLGSAGTRLQRLMSPAYDDGLVIPRTLSLSGSDLPGARRVSNSVSAQSGAMPNSRTLSSLVWQWGQFLDHDLDLSTTIGPLEAFPIPVPAGDPQFDPLGTGVQEIALNRSVYDLNTGWGGVPREQMNQITHWLDGSNVYGSDPIRAGALRTFSGGLLKTSPGELLPFNDSSSPLPNDRGPGLIASGEDFVAGDIRANEQIGLSALHTLFVREHNRLATAIAAADSTLGDEEIYQIARRIVGAELQVITYHEFLPALLGADALRPYSGYSDTVDPRIANVFSAAAFRFGHSMLVPELLRLGPDGATIAAGPIALRNAFFQPAEIIDTGIEAVLLGLSRQQAQEIDTRIVDDVRNFLFGPPGAGGFDLASLNIQRGRDHGLPPYNTVRLAYGLTPVTDFFEVTGDPELAAALAGVYASVDDIDLWVGILAEDHLPGSSVGELLSAILIDQFERLRDGDRFFYLNDPFFVDNPLLAAIGIVDIGAIRLSHILYFNTAYGDFQGNVFLTPGALAAVAVPVLQPWSILLLVGLLARIATRMNPGPPARA